MTLSEISQRMGTELPVLGKETAKDVLLEVRFPQGLLYPGVGVELDFDLREMPRLDNVGMQELESAINLL